MFVIRNCIERFGPAEQAFPDDTPFCEIWAAISRGFHVDDIRKGVRERFHAAHCGRVRHAESIGFLVNRAGNRNRTSNQSLSYVHGTDSIAYARDDFSIVKYAEVGSWRDVESMRVAYPGCRVMCVPLSVSSRRLLVHDINISLMSSAYEMSKRRLHGEHERSVSAARESVRFAVAGRVALAVEHAIIAAESESEEFGQCVTWGRFLESAMLATKEARSVSGHAEFKVWKLIDERIDKVFAVST